MTIRDHDTRVLLGAFVLGGLSEEDVQAFRDHLRSCLECRQDLDRMNELPRLLELVRTSENGSRPPGTPPGDARAGLRTFTRP